MMWACRAVLPFVIHAVIGPRTRLALARSAKMREAFAEQRACDIPQASFS